MRSHVVSLALLVAPVVLGAQARQSGAAQSEPKTWQTPFEANGRPRDPYAAQDGKVWFVGQAANYIAYLQPEDGSFKKFEIDAGTNPHNLVVDKAVDGGVTTSDAAL